MKGGSCYRDPQPWTDPADEEEAKWAAEECLLCPLLDPCKEFAARFRWHHPAVIAGWQPPDSHAKATTNGYRPPWADPSSKPYRLNLGAKR